MILSLSALWVGIYRHDGGDPKNDGPKQQDKRWPVCVHDGAMSTPERDKEGREILRMTLGKEVDKKNLARRKQFSAVRALPCRSKCAMSKAGSFLGSNSPVFVAQWTPLPFEGRSQNARWSKGSSQVTNHHTSFPQYGGRPRKAVKGF